MIVLVTPSSHLEGVEFTADFESAATRLDCGRRVSYAARQYGVPQMQELDEVHQQSDDASMASHKTYVEELEVGKLEVKVD